MTSLLDRSEFCASLSPCSGQPPGLDNKLAATQPPGWPILLFATESHLRLLRPPDEIAEHRISRPCAPKRFPSRVRDSKPPTTTAATAVQQAAVKQLFLRSSTLTELHFIEPPLWQRRASQRSLRRQRTRCRASRPRSFCSTRATSKSGLSYCSYTQLCPSSSRTAGSARRGCTELLLLRVTAPLIAVPEGLTALMERLRAALRCG